MIKRQTNWIIECDHPHELVPVLIHTHQQRLIDKINISSTNVISPTSVSVRMAGLIPTAWPLTTGVLNRRTGAILFEAPQNPTITFSNTQIDESIPTRVVLEILVDGERAWAADVLLQPPRTTPTEIEYATSLAAFVLPQANEIIELIRRTREIVFGRDARLGFPSVSPIRAAQSIYLQVARSREPSYAWESGPCSLLGNGQLVRLPRHILREGQATCIDLALLLCAGFEHIRRLPVILALNMGNSIWHVIPGVRTNDDSEIPSEPLLSDIQAIRDSCEASKTYLFDSEALIRGVEPRDADALARQRLSTAQHGFLLDVQAARNSGFWPIAVADPPQRSSGHRPTSDVIHFEHHDRIPDELIRGVASETSVILVGDTLDQETGISRSAFAKAISEYAGLGDECDLFRAGYRIEKEKGRAALVQMALQALSVQGSRVRNAYNILAALPVQTVISFHPDPILERVLLALQPPFRALLDDSDLTDLPLGHSSRELYLLGGSALTGHGLVLTFDDQDRLLLRIKLLARGLRARLASGTILMLSCDLNESNLNELYLEATRHLRKPRPIYLSGSHPPKQTTLPIRIVSMSPLDLLETLERVLPVPAPDAAVLAHSKTMRRPYKYLDYFEAEDLDVFFGRDDERNLLTGEVLASRNRVTVLCGCSGVGKTSLVKAALIPHLERDHQLKVTYSRFGSNPEVSIALALRASGKGDASADIKATLSELDLGNPTQRIIVVDQTEEALIKLGAPVLRNFFAKVVEILADSEISLRFLFIIREDYLGRLATFQKEFPNLLSSVFQLKGLTRDAARLAIVRPAVNCGLSIDEDVVEEILDDLSPDLIVPAHLQIICDQLYERSRESGSISQELYSSMGRASSILRNHLESVMQQLPEALEQTARKILRALVTSENTKDQVSLATVIGREALPLENIETVMHELIHVHRLVRELTGDPVRYELSHESLAASVAGWLDAKEAKVRAVQEILDQELINIRTLNGYRMPRDRMRLINEYRQDIHFEAEAICIVCSELYLVEDISHFWKQRLQSLPPNNQYEVLWRVLRHSPQEALAYILKDELRPLFTVLPETEFPLDITELLAKTVTTVSSDILATGIKLVSLDRTQKCQEFTLREVQNSSEVRAKEIVRAWLDTVKLGDPQSDTRNPFLALAKLLAIVFDISDATQQIRRSCSEPLATVLCGDIFLKAIHRKGADIERYRDLIGGALLCIQPDEVGIEKLAYMWLADTLESFPYARSKMERLLLRLIHQSRASATELPTSHFRILQLVLIRYLAGLRNFESLGGARYIDLLSWVQQLPPSVRKKDPDLFEETIDELVRVAFLDQSCRAEEALLATLSDIDDDQAQRITRTWRTGSLKRWPAHSSHGSQMLSLAYILSRLVRPQMLWRVLKAMSAHVSPRILAHPAVGEGLDSRKGLNEQQHRQVVRSLIELPACQSPVEDLARQWLLSQLEPSNETMAALESVTLSVIKTPILLEGLSHSEYSAILHGISFHLRELKTWSLLHPDRASQIMAALQVNRLYVSQQQEYLIGNLLAPYPDAYETSLLIRSSTLSTRIGVMDYLVTLDSAEESVVREVERELNGSEVSYRLMLARILCRWGRPSGLLAAVDVLKRGDLSHDLHLVCAECFQSAPAHVRKMVIDTRFRSNSSKGKLVDGLLMLAEVKWLLNDTYVLDWLLDLNLKVAPLAKLRELLVRLMPELTPKLSAIADSGNNRQRYSARLILREYGRKQLK